MRSVQVEVVALRFRQTLLPACKCGPRLFGHVRHTQNIMAELDPAIPLIEAQPCPIIGIAGSSPAMRAVGCISSDHASGAPAGETRFAVRPRYWVICSEAGLPLSKIRISM
jgi:hypothetical protein